VVQQVSSYSTRFVCFLLKLLSIGPRWASVNLGVFLCMTCSSLHRKLGVHISQVRSCTLDRWTEQQLEHMKNMGNAKARQLYEANLPRGFQRPSSEQLDVLERWIRDKYERKLFMKEEDRNRLEAQSGSSNSRRLHNSWREDIYVPNNPQWNSVRDTSSPALRVLLEMGFRRDDAITALHISRGDIMQAVDWILIHGSASSSSMQSRTFTPQAPLSYPSTTNIWEDSLVNEKDLEAQDRNVQLTKNTNNSENVQQDNEDSNFADFEEFEEFVSAPEPSNPSPSNNRRDEIRDKILELYKQVQSSTKQSHLLQEDKDWDALTSRTTKDDPSNEQSATQPDPFEDLLSLTSKEAKPTTTTTKDDHQNNDDGVFSGFDT